MVHVEYFTHLITEVPIVILNTVNLFSIWNAAVSPHALLIIVARESRAPGRPEAPIRRQVVARTRLVMVYLRDDQGVMYRSKPLS